VLDVRCTRTGMLKIHVDASNDAKLCSDLGDVLRVLMNALPHVAPSIGMDNMA
jgi:hypothetical protein